MFRVQYKPSDKTWYFLCEKCVLEVKPETATTVTVGLGRLERTFRSSSTLRYALLIISKEYPRRCIAAVSCSLVFELDNDRPDTRRSFQSAHGQFDLESY